MPGGNIKWPRNETLWQCHIHIDVKLHASAPRWAIFFVKHRPLLCEEWKQNGIRPVSSRNLKQLSSSSASSASHVLSALALFSLRSFEEVWQGMLRESPDADLRGYMLNCRGISAKVCSALLVLFLTRSCACSNLKALVLRERRYSRNIWQPGVCWRAFDIISASTENHWSML